MLNRRGLQQVLSREIRWRRRSRSELVAALVDIDDFKRINDRLGHAVGDVVLKEIARKLKSSLRAMDYVGRIGGDEFMILLPQTGPADGVQVAQKVRLALSATPISLSSGTVKVTASLGVVAAPEATSSLDELLSQTHFVPARSKQAGKNRVSFDPPGNEHGDWGQNALSNIHEALRRGEGFRTVMEPIVRLADEHEVGYEFLSRPPDGVFDIPDLFRICLEANTLTLLGHRCFKTCIAAAASLPRKIRRHLNLFPSTIIDIPVRQLLGSLPADRLRRTYCVELSEQQMIGDPSCLARPVETLKRSGVLVAFDDVGFGRTCLENLILLEPDIVKIDRKCVTGIAEDLEVVKQLGIRYGQGFLWGRPE